MYIVWNCHFVLYISSHTIQTHSHLFFDTSIVRSRRTNTVNFVTVFDFLKKIVFFPRSRWGFVFFFFWISGGGVFVITRARCYCWRFDGRRGTVSSLKPWPPRTRTLLARDWLKTLPPLARDTKLSSVSPQTPSALVFGLRSLAPPCRYLSPPVRKTLTRGYELTNDRTIHRAHRSRTRTAERSGNTHTTRGARKSTQLSM